MNSRACGKGRNSGGSVPPFSVVRGRLLAYQMTVKSLKGNVRFALDAAPKGMTITTKGLIHWTAPLHTADDTESVIVKVTDASNQTVFQNFKLTLVEPAGVKR